MAYHNSDVNGPIQQHTIITEGVEKSVEHDKKVDQFNSEHTVFFNQSTPQALSWGTSGCKFYFITTCLYADKAMKSKIKDPEVTSQTILVNNAVCKIPPYKIQVIK
jgi:hypothetical protein